jgi:hypothetical protein
MPLLGGPLRRLAWLADRADRAQHAAGQRAHDAVVDDLDEVLLGREGLVAHPGLDEVRDGLM